MTAKEVSEIGKDFLEYFIGNLINNISPITFEPSKESIAPFSKDKIVPATPINHMTRGFQIPKFASQSKSIGQRTLPWQFSQKSPRRFFNQANSVRQLKPRSEMLPSLMQQRSDTLPIPFSFNQPNQESLETIASPASLPVTQKPMVQEINIPQSINPQFRQQAGDPLERLIPFLRDPMVKSIDCAGPGKVIFINRSGITKPTQINFTPQEIEEVLQFYSQKTRIPLIPGTFKAAIQEHIITAMISDNARTRFHIERKPSNPIPYRKF